MRVADSPAAHRSCSRPRRGHPARRRRGQDERRIRQGREEDRKDTGLKAVARLGGKLKREASLPGAAGTGEREQTQVLAPEQLLDLSQLTLTPDQRRRL